MLIAIEGIDGSGKGTQSRLLVDRVRQTGKSAELIGFPRYAATHFGRAAGQFLNGRFGEIDEASPFLAALLFAGDRFESRDVLHTANLSHDVVVLDRYVASNIAHQGAKLDDVERAELADWISRIEFDVYGLPKPDATILLDLPARHAQHLIARKERRSYTDRTTDLHEADVDYQERVRQVYLSLAENSAGWRTVSCLDGEAIRAIEEVSAAVWNTLEGLL